MKIPIFHQSPCSYKYSPEKRFKNNLMSFTWKSELNQSHKCPSSADPTSLPESTTTELHSLPPLLGEVVIVFWNLSTYTHKMTQYLLCRCDCPGSESGRAQCRIPPELSGPGAINQLPGLELVQVYSFQGWRTKLMKIYLCNPAAVHNYVLNVIYILPKVSDANIKMENVSKVKMQEEVKKKCKTIR